MADHFIDGNFHFKWNILLAFSYCVGCSSSDLFVLTEGFGLRSALPCFLWAQIRKSWGEKKGWKKNPLCQFLEISAVFKLWSVNTCGERKIYFLLDIFALIKYCLWQELIFSDAHCRIMTKLLNGFEPRLAEAWGMIQGKEVPSSILVCVWIELQWKI